MPSEELLTEFAQNLKQRISAEVRTDQVTRLLYSTDASIYQIEPLGVVWPRTVDELAAIVETAASYEVPILARGSGSSLAGQAIGAALILDCSRYLNRILEINAETGTAVVEPGVILNALNRRAAQYGLQFGPDPASAERATLGGSIANNASGAHSIRYGMAADHLISAEVVLADGSLATFGSLALADAARKAAAGGVADHSRTSSLEADIYRAALDIRDRYADTIRERWPRTWRQASGYNLNYLIPWVYSQPPHWEAPYHPLPDQTGAVPLPCPPIPPGEINLAALLAGSEGTLAVIRRATLRMVPLPSHTILGVLAYPSLLEACQAVPELLDYAPSAVELIPQSMIRLARSVPAYAHQCSFLDPLSANGSDPAALLVVEFSGEDPAYLREQARSLGPQVLLAESAAEQRQVWGVRKMGLGILMSRAGDVKPTAFIEDLAVPVARLGEFVREMECILEAHNTQADFYAHASAGCLHIRPLLNLKSSEGVRVLRSLATEAMALTVRLGGSASGEHGDGLARTEWLEHVFGSELLEAFGELKQAADPLGLLNPGKIVPAQSNRSVREPGLPPRMDADLRYGPGYQTHLWTTRLDFSSQAGLGGAIEQCNGAGVCRKEDGVMCPSFQATQDEMHSTRGRANLLRALIAGRFPSDNLAEKAVYEALDLCLACKGCKAECPSAVDMAKLKYEFMSTYFERHRRKLSDYLFANIDRLAWFGHFFAPLVNFLFRMQKNPVLGGLVEGTFGLAKARPLPPLAGRPLRSLVRKNGSRSDPMQPELFFLSDAFTEFFHPETGLAALKVLEAAGYRVQVLPVIGAGRTLISKGFLEPARRHAARLIDTVQKHDPQGSIPIVGVEPSEVYTLRDEYLDLFPDDPRVTKLAGRTFMVDEFLIRPAETGRQPRIARLSGLPGSTLSSRRKVLLHGHCYQKAQPPAADGYPVGVAASVALLEAAGFEVKVIEAGCCGMAGAFGYEAAHYSLSQQVAELNLLPAVRKAGADVIIAAAGVSCKEQIKDGTGRAVVHPITLIPLDQSD